MDITNKIRKVILDTTGSVAYPVMTSGAGILSFVAKPYGFVIVPENLEDYEKIQKMDVVLIE